MSRPFQIVPLIISLLFQLLAGHAQDIARPPATVSLKDENGTTEALTDSETAA